MSRTSEFTGWRAWLYKVPLLRMLVAHRTCELVDIKPQAPGAPIVVVVHGTWSPASAWTLDGSDMRTAIADALPGCGWARFRWSGLNGLSARLDAADGLRAAIEKQIPTEHSGAPLIAIGHSHGGNIIAWASALKSKRLRAAVYLNTPFIQARRGTHSYYSLATGTLLLGSLSAVLVAIVIWWRFAPPLPTLPTEFWAHIEARLLSFWSRLRDTLGGNLWIPSALAYAFLASLLPAVALAYKARLAGARLQKTTESTRNVEAEYSAFSTGDEVDVLFALALASKRASRTVSTLAAVLGVVLMVGLILALWLHPPGPPSQHPVTLVLMACVATSISVLTFAPYVAALSVNVITYGWQQGLLAMDGEIIGTPSPSGCAQIFTLPWPTTDPEPKHWYSRAETAHSLACEDPKVIMQVANWLSQLVNGTKYVPKSARALELAAKAGDN